ncbi:MAG: MBL fold metallo-hydrolase [Spirobacillus cienkowskii]|jgi:sulfur dioxygenase|uniref:MBL fold metallo-hydrolase n=1 Tax=Spirobacillus cienkowskii TaxID=495820 RepID=A0A369KPI2_9BACT|nr:MAG: MBL fold metallo-hydrolase [Spirobacillus cienkowskii]
MSCIFKQIQDPISFTYTYIIGDSKTKEVAIIDSVNENYTNYISIIQNNHWTLKYLIETHTHADHITAIKKIKKIFPNTKVLLSNKSLAQYEFTKVQDKDIFYVGDIEFMFFETPGHTTDSISVLINKNRLLTGDCLFIGSCGRTDFQNGNNKDMFNSLNKILLLDDDVLVYPGHDYNNRYVSNIQEEKITNKVLRLKKFEEFEAELNSWKLPPPKKIQESVPANIVGGID